MEKYCKKNYILKFNDSLSKGDKGDNGSVGQGAFLYIRYASDTLGTDFSSLAHSTRNFIGILNSNIPLNPIVGDFNFIQFHGQNGLDGQDGAQNFIYFGYSDDINGTNFTLNPTSTKNFIAILNSSIEILIPNVGDFTGLWKKYIGIDGTNGINSFNYIGYADDVTGTNFTLDGTQLKTHVAFLSTNIEIPNPIVTDFANLFKKYIGADGNDGSPIELQVTVDNIEWKLASEISWQILIPLASIKGLDGNVGIDGEDVFLYLAYADDINGTGFTTTFNLSKEYIAILKSIVEINPLNVSNFTGLWVKYKGDGDRWSTTSTTQNTIQNTPLTLIVDPDLAYTTGQRVVASQTGVPSNRVEGIVQSYGSTSGQLVIVPNQIFGLGVVINNWEVSLQGSDTIAPIDLTFNWNRNIKRIPTIGLNIFNETGAVDLLGGIDDLLFPTLTAIISINSQLLREIGSLISPNIIGTIIPNDSIILDRRIIKDPNNLASIINNPVGNNINFTDGTLTIIQGVTEQYRLEADLNTNTVLSTIQSVIRDVTGIFPFFYGMATAGLTGSPLYSALTKLIQTQGNKNVTLNGSSLKIYFIYPEDYPNLTSVIDNNGFEILTGTFGGTPSIVSLTSVGLGTNYTKNFKVYESISLTTVNNGLFQFIF